MKFLNFILVVIAVILLLISFRLAKLETLAGRANDYSGLLIKAEQSLINSNQKLELEIAALRQQIADLTLKFNKK
jgi:hypothetical protein